MTRARQPRVVHRSPVSTLLAGVAIGALAATAVAQDATAHPVSRAADLLERVRPCVETVCGREFPAPPRVVELSAREARDVFRHDLRDEIARRYPDASDAQRATLLDASARNSVASCVARYSFHTESIVLVRESFDVQRAGAGFTADEAEDLLIAVLAHEAVHALDDAHHDLEAFYADAPDAEGLRARAMIAEGRAVHLGRAAAAAAGASEKARGLMPGGAHPRDLRAWLLRLTYEGGRAFVADLERRGGARASERALEDPPDQTHIVLHPELWPEHGADEAPAARLDRAGLGTDRTVLSELQLRARYAALLDAERAEGLFADFRGGAQVLISSTNVAVLSFATAEGAERYVEVAGEEAPTAREGKLVLRAFGPAAEQLIARLKRASPAPSNE